MKRGKKKVRALSADGASISAQVIVTDVDGTTRTVQSYCNNGHPTDTLPCPHCEWDGTCPDTISGMCSLAVNGFAFVGCLDECELHSRSGRGTPLVVPPIDFDTPTGDRMVEIDKGFGGRSVGRRESGR